MAFSDTLVDAGGTLLENHTPSGGTAYTLHGTSGGLKIASGGSGIDSYTAYGSAYWTVDNQGSADQYATATWGSTFYGFVLANWVTDQNNWCGYYGAGTGSAGAKLSKMVSGTRTDLISFQGAASSVVKVVMTSSGTTAAIYKDGVQQGTTQTISGVTPTTTQAVMNSASIGSTAVIATYLEFGPNAGGGTTMTIGSWSWAGISGYLAQTLNLATGAWSWSGITMTPNAGTNMTIGSWSWSGISGSFAQTLNLNIGAWTWTGISGSFAQIINLNTGAWSWSGISGSFARTLNLGTGLWSWGGISGSFKQTLNLGTGSWSWVGLHGNFGTQVNAVGDSVLGYIDIRGFGTIGLIDTTGYGVSGGIIYSSYGVLGTIDLYGWGLKGTIDTAGYGVEGLI